MSHIQEQVDRLIDTRGGRELLHVMPVDRAEKLNEFIYHSPGATSSYMLVTDAGRVIVNTGMGFEAPHHKALFDEVHAAPTSYIITTQGHVDHVGGVSAFRDPGTRYVAHASNPACQADDQRLTGFRRGTALIWFPNLLPLIRDLATRYGPGEQDVPTPDITFESRMQLTTGGLDIELIHAPGGETIDSCIVWLPRYRIALISNLFGPLFPHFPNFNTLRGDKYRFPVPYMANVDRVRALRPRMLITGRSTPIEGEELIDACLARMSGAVEYVHDRTLAEMNAGKDVFEIMRDIALPPELRVGQGYGKVAWAVRTIWESYTGWFRRKSTSDLYASDPAEATAALATLAQPDEIIALAREKLSGGDVANAIRLAEAVLANGESADARRVVLDAHRSLLESGGDESFWESGWLRHNIGRLEAELGS